MGKTGATKTKQRQATGYDDPGLSRLADALAVGGALGSTLLVSRSSKECKPEGTTKGGLNMDRAAGILDRWGLLGSDALSSLSEVDWQPAQCMIDAMREWGEVQKGNYLKLLEQSERRFGSFGEPLRVDFGVHRWLWKQREESYSDWFAWIVGELRQPDLVFRLFGIKEDPTAPKVRGEDFLRPEREVCILEGTRRLDFVIRYTGAVLIVVEVKVTGADSAETAKHKDYIDWMNVQPEPFRRAILVAIDGSKDEYYGFRFVPWADVCIELRRIAPRYFSGRPVVAAMILAFVSAVERNLLDMSLPAPEASAMTWMAHSRVFDHIKESLQGELR
jgi:hypothetical protein